MRLYLLPLLFLAACTVPAAPDLRTPVASGASPRVVTAATLAPPQQSDVDAQGCAASAGLQWSVLMGRCLRPAEHGLRLRAIDGGGSVLWLLMSPDLQRGELPLVGAGAVQLRWSGRGWEGVGIAGEPWLVTREGERLVLLVRGVITHRE